MALFRRKKSTKDLEPQVDAQAVDSEITDDLADQAKQGSETTPEATNGEEDTAPSSGPWDVTSIDDRGARIDLGAIWLPGVDGMQLRFEVAQGTQTPVGVSLSIGKSSLLINAFAAPRSEGIWQEVREEIISSAVAQGGSADEVPGPFGTEVRARLAVRTDKQSGLRPVRFVGSDGPRWFVRGVMTGEAAVKPEAARILEAIFADVVVVRDDQARAPREPLPLSLPVQGDGKIATSTGDVPAEDKAASESQSSKLTMPKRGPEITEIR